MSEKSREKTASKTSLPQEGIASFIRKTYEILEEGKFTDIVSWSEDGNFIVIKDVEEFSQKILPVYFKHNNFTSFVRQLNIYNFHKKKTFNTHHVYYNELFKRGKIDLLRHIKRKNESTSRSLTLSSTISDNYVPTATDENAQSSYQIAQENQMLKSMNQKALTRINFLETKINEVMNENRVLLKRISEKQESEENLKSFLYSYVNPRPRTGLPSTTNPEFLKPKVQNPDHEQYSNQPRTATFIQMEPQKLNRDIIMEGNEVHPYGAMGYIPSTSIYLPTQLGQQNKQNLVYANNGFPPNSYSEESPNNIYKRNNLNEPERFLNDHEIKKQGEFENEKEGERNMDMDFSIFPDDKNEPRY